MFYHRMDPSCRIVNLPLSMTFLTNLTPRLMVWYKSGKGSGNYLNAIPATISLEIFLLHPKVVRWPSMSQGWLDGLGRNSSLHSLNSWILESFVVGVIGSHCLIIPHDSTEQQPCLCILHINSRFCVMCYHHGTLHNLSRTFAKLWCITCAIQLINRAYILLTTRNISKLL